MNIAVTSGVSISTIVVLPRLIVLDFMCIWRHEEPNPDEPADS